MAAELDGFCVSAELEYFLYVNIPSGNYRSMASVSYQLAHML